MSAAQALQQAIYETLSADTDLTALIGADAVFDRLIDRASPPYIVLDDATTNDWSTASEEGTEHLFAIDVWTEGEGRKTGQSIAEAVRVALHESELDLGAEYALINLRFQSAKSGRERNSRRYRTQMKFRAVIEAA